EFSLLQRIRRYRQLHGPAQLILDHVEKTLDLQRRRGGFTALGPHERVPQLAIRKPDVEQCAAEQNDADDHEKQRHVFAEERAADLLPAEAAQRPIDRSAQGAEPARVRALRERLRQRLFDRLAHSTTRSVMARKRAGTARSIALAALRLSASS